MFINPQSYGGDYPRLKGKGYEIKELGPALSWLWKQRMDHDLLLHKQIALLLDTSVAMDMMLHESSTETWRWSQEESAKFMGHVWRYVRLYATIAHHYLLQGLLLFNVTVKLHYLVHLGMRAKELSPRLAWCFAGEDFMQKMALLASSCVKGNRPHAVSCKMMQKYLWYLRIRYNNFGL